MATRYSSLTVEPGPHCGIGTRGRPFNVDTDPRALEPLETWPLSDELDDGDSVNKWHDARDCAARFEAEQTRLFDELLPKSTALGDEVDDDGKVHRWHKHRVAEAAVARAILERAVPHARQKGMHEDADRLFRKAKKMLACRQQGPVGFNSDGKVVVEWEDKCGQSKYCPDEALKEARRLAEVYLPEVQAHANQGGRVYKGVLTIPNCKPGMLQSEIDFIFKRFRNNILRAQLNNDKRFPITGALVILETPLSRDRYWNIHLNFLILTDRWLDYRAFQEAWGFGLHIRQHQDFSDAGMNALFNELIKYATRALPEKSTDGRHDAPAMCEWTGAELHEWDSAMHGLRRTRGYGTLYGLGRPEGGNPRVRRWLAYLSHQEGGYRIQRRAHDLPLHTDMLLRHEHFDLFLIRGNKSTTKMCLRGPP